MQSARWLSISAFEHASLAPLASMGGPLTPNLWKGTKTQSGSCRCLFYNHENVGSIVAHVCAMHLCLAQNHMHPGGVIMKSCNKGNNAKKWDRVTWSSKTYYRRQFHHEQAAGTPGSMCSRCLRKSCRMTCCGQSVSQDFEEIDSILSWDLRSIKSIEKYIEALKEPRHSHVTMVTWC